jgi:8-oxo-dGTP diphosphatase
MRYVYCIAFRGDEFVMVFNPRREGWEMPGGKVEEGESDLEAMKREFREEVGHELVVTSSMELSEGAVFAGRMGERAGPGEMDWCSFDDLPDQLSFPKVEYIPLITWARKELTSRKADEREGAPA